MSQNSDPANGLTGLEDRRLGTFGGSESGPLLVALGGLHGNEPAGVLATRRVLERLGELEPSFEGKLVGLAGNLPALSLDSRYVDEDLNRIWSLERLAATDQSGWVPQTTEENERCDLLGLVRAVLSETKGPAYFLDLHTTSAPGAPFSILADTLANRRIALGLPAPLVLGLEEHLDGTFLNFINELGHVAIGFEGGQHKAPSSVDALELAIWRMLLMVGCLAPRDCPQLDGLVRSVATLTEGSPRVVEIRYRHPVEPEDRFEMEPGFRNLQSVRVGQTLARDRTGTIRASESGHLLMPLYQAQGEDGFFMVRRVRPIWLFLAKIFRTWRLDRVLKFMPGVRPHPTRDGFIVNPLVARWFVVEAFHLLGFRRRHAEEGSLVLTRRKETSARK